MSVPVTQIFAACETRLVQLRAGKWKTVAANLSSSRPACSLIPLVQRLTSSAGTRVGTRHWVHLPFQCESLQMASLAWLEPSLPCPRQPHNCMKRTTVGSNGSLGVTPMTPRWQSQSSMHPQAAGLKHLTLFTLLGLAIALCCRYAWVRSESSLTSSACTLTLFFGMATHAHVKPPALA